MGLSENGVYSQWNSHLVGIMISKTIGCRGTLFSDKPIYSADQEVHQPTAGARWKTPRKNPGLNQFLGHPSIVPCTVFQGSYNTPCALSTLYCCCSLPRKLLCWKRVEHEKCLLTTAFSIRPYLVLMICPLFLGPKDPQQMFPCFSVI